MIVSHKWLTEYLGNDTPSADAVAAILTRGAFEIEEVRCVEGDTVIDVDVLPNRAHDCLCHRGIAKEIAVLGDVSFVDKTPDTVIEDSQRTIGVDVCDTAVCRRYVARVVEDVTVGESPAWLKESLVALGQRSINTIVDATNYVMYDIGQPLHAFDADKLDGGIIVRRAEEGEHMTTLDGKDVTLTSEDTVIADQAGVLAIAGVKGGAKAEVDEQTTTIVIESANFHPVAVRKTSGRIGIKTDSSKRFENELSPELAAEAMERVTALIRELSPEAKVGPVVDVYPRRAAPYVSGFSFSRVNDVLGTTMTREEMIAILDRFGFAYTIVESPREAVVVRVTELVGTPHKIAASISYDAPRAFDCSSLVAYVYAQAGIQIPRMAVDQYAYTERVSRDDVRAGDIVFMNSGRGDIYYKTKEYCPGMQVPEGVDHCGMYVGDGDIIHSSRERGKSVVEAMDAIADYRIVGYGRVRGADDPHVAVTVPHMRLDLRIAEDFIEEIGRVYGYDRVPSRDPHALRAPVVLSVYYIANAARRVLDTAGYAEVYTSSFRSAGEWEVLYPAASDKNFLRTDLATAMEDRLAFNARNMDLFGTERIAVYEIGSVFTEGTGERTLLSIGVAYPRMKEGKARESAKKDIADVCVGYAAKLGIAEVPMLTEKEVERGYVVEIDIGALAGEAPIPPDYGDTLDTPDDVPAYKSFSPYPYMTRDIAFWTPEGTSVDDARVAVEGEGLPLAIRTDLFDTFAKDGRVSYAFRIVFQAPDRTLTDEEVNGIMDSVYARVAARGWEGR